MTMDGNPQNGILLEVRNLHTYFRTSTQPIRAVDGVSFSIGRGETVALVGESGCGKSVTALSLTRLAPHPGFYAGGQILFRGDDVLRMREQRLSSLRGGEIAYIFQEPATSLNPVFRVGWQIMEAVKLHSARRRAEANGAPALRPTEQVVRLMEMVGLPDPKRRMNAYPHELSGGMQQRVMVAMALACSPSLLVADEPTTALDVTIQAQILELLADLQRSMKMAILLITHNLGLVADLAQRTNVMYAGRIVESGPSEEVLVRPAHPYTRGLLDAVPRLSGGKTLTGIKGVVPNPARLPPGCKFAPRCPKAQDICGKTEPELTGEEHGRSARCWFPLA